MSATAASEDELRNALSKDFEELFVDLGRFGLDIGPRDAFEKGMRIFKALDAELHRTICEAELPRHLVEDEADELMLAAAIADLVATVSENVPVATVAALIVKTNLPQYCVDYW